MLYTERIKALRSDTTSTRRRSRAGYPCCPDHLFRLRKGQKCASVECLIQLAKFYDVDMNYITGVSDTLRPFPHA